MSNPMERTFTLIHYKCISTKKKKTRGLQNKEYDMVDSDCASLHILLLFYIFYSACLYAGGWSSYLQGFPLTHEKLGDVPCHSLHQFLGVVPLDFKLALLLIINLQMENIGNKRSDYPSH